MSANESECGTLTRAEFHAEAEALRRVIAGYRSHLSVFCDAATANIDHMTVRLERLLNGGKPPVEHFTRQYFRDR